MSKKKKHNIKKKPSEQISHVSKIGSSSENFGTWDKICYYSNSRYGVIAALLLLLAVVFIRYAEPLTDPDLFWHVKLGEYMVKNFTLKPDHSIYSWTIADPNWVYNAWIPEIIFYVLYSLFGIYIFHVLHYLCFFSLIALFLYFNHKLNEPLNPFYIFLILLIMVAIHLNMGFRPEIFSLVLLGLTAFVYFYSITTEKNLFWLYPIIMLIWVNSHGVFIFGMMFISAAFAGELMNYVLKRQTLSGKSLRKFMVSVILSYAALIVTPYGYKWLLSIMTYFTDPQFMSQARLLVAYQPVFYFFHPAKYILLSAAITYCILVTYLLMFKRQFNIPVVLVNVLFIYFSFMYGRSAYLYLPIWYFSMVFLISKSGIYIRSKSFSSQIAPIFLILFIVGSAWTVHWTLYWPQKHRYFGFGLGEYFPDKTADFLLEHKFEGPLFNTYELGGFLLWKLYPYYRVFIDGRHGPYSKIVADEYRQFEIGNNFEAFTKKYAFKTAIVKLDWLTLVGNFVNSPDWEMVYFDQSAALFVHKSVLPENLHVDLGPKRFKDIKAYESLVLLQFAYLQMKDFKNAQYMMDMMESTHNYGRFKPLIKETRKNLKKLIEIERIKNKKE